MFKSDILNIRKVRSEANIKFFEYFGQPNVRCLFKIWKCLWPFEVGCPKNSKHWIFDLNRTFRILKMPDLKIFRLWISVFDSLRFKLRISRISRIYSYLEKFDQFAIFVRSEFFCTFETFFSLFALLDFFAHCILKYCCFSLESLESLHLL